MDNCQLQKPAYRLSSNITGTKKEHKKYKQFFLVCVIDDHKIPC